MLQEFSDPEDDEDFGSPPSGSPPPSSLPDDENFPEDEDFGEDNLEEDDDFTSPPPTDEDMDGSCRLNSLHCLTEHLHQRNMRNVIVTSPSEPASAHYSPFVGP